MSFLLHAFLILFGDDLSNVIYNRLACAMFHLNLVKVAVARKATDAATPLWRCCWVLRAQLQKFSVLQDCYSIIGPMLAKSSIVRKESFVHLARVMDAGKRCFNLGRIITLIDQFVVHELLQEVRPIARTSVNPVVKFVNHKMFISNPMPASFVSNLHMQLIKTNHIYGHIWQFHWNAIRGMWRLLHLGHPNWIKELRRGSAVAIGAVTIKFNSCLPFGISNMKLVRN